MIAAGSLAGWATTSESRNWSIAARGAPTGLRSRPHVSGGTHPRVLFTDELGTVCENVGSPVTFFASLLRGTVDGDVLFAVFNVAKCGPVTIRFLTGESAIWILDDQGNADPADDTLFDGSVLWHRV